MSTTGLRFFTVYGPWGRPDMSYFKFVKNIINGLPIDVYNHGNHSRDFTYIDDIVDGILKIIERPAIKTLLFHQAMFLGQSIILEMEHPLA